MYVMINSTDSQRYGVSSIAESADVLLLRLSWQLCPMSVQLTHLLLQTIMPRLRAFPSTGAARGVLNLLGRRQQRRLPRSRPRTAQRTPPGPVAMAPAAGRAVLCRLFLQLTLHTQPTALCKPGGLKS
jgi:hypothetical protein